MGSLELPPLHRRILEALREADRRMTENELREACQESTDQFDVNRSDPVGTSLMRLQMEGLVDNHGFEKGRQYKGWGMGWTTTWFLTPEGIASVNPEAE